MLAAQNLKSSVTRLTCFSIVNADNLIVFRIQAIYKSLKYRFSFEGRRIKLEFIERIVVYHALVIAINSGRV